VFSSTNTVHDVASVDDFLNVTVTETAPLIDYLEFEFLLEYDVFAPGVPNTSTQVTRTLPRIPALLYKGIYGTRRVTR